MLYRSQGKDMLVEKEYTYKNEETGKTKTIKRKYYTLPKDKKYRKRPLKQAIDGADRLNQYQFDLIYEALKKEICESDFKCIMAILGKDKKSRNLLENYSCTLIFDIEEEENENECLLNKFAVPDKPLKSPIKIKEIYKYGDDEFDPKELGKMYLADDKIKLYNSGVDIEKEYYSSGGFSIKMLFNCIVDFENIVRPKYTWFGGIDIHHKFFEGLYYDKKNERYEIAWGS
jgi:hypothetical protein